MFRKWYIYIVIATLFLSCSKETNKKVVKETNPQKVDFVLDKNLSVEEYSDVKGFFPQEGIIPTPEIAFQLAESILNRIYGKEQIQSEKPFSINIENDIWIIVGSLEKGLKGGVAYIEIRKTNGEILKVIHTE